MAVDDTEAPEWSVPAGIAVATDPGAATAVVSYTATVIDDVGVVSSSCTPGSASTFTLGTTTVACIAVDATGNVGTASFDVTVGVDAGSVDTLIDRIADLGLPKGVERSLQAPLKRVTKPAEDDNPDNDQAVCDKLDEFSANVADRLADGSLTVAQADPLVAFSHALELEYGCE